MNTPNLDRLRESMVDTYERWHDGVGYDLDAIRGASPEERFDIELILLGQNPPMRRDVEALAVLDTERARARLRAAAKSRNVEVRAMVRSVAPALFADDERVAALVEDIGRAAPFAGLSAPYTTDMRVFVRVSSTILTGVH
jgi:hypothetical protein